MHKVIRMLIATGFVIGCVQTVHAQEVAGGSAPDAEPIDTEPLPAPELELEPPPPIVDPALRKLYLGDQGGSLGSPSGPRDLRLKREKKDKKKDAWKHRLELGAVAYRGNKDSELFLGKFRTGKETKDYEIDLRAGINYGTTDGEKDRQNAEANGKYRHNLDNQFYTAVELRYYYDAIANLDYQFTAIWSLGYDVVRTESTLFSLEAGPAYIREKKDEEAKDFIAARFAESLERKLNDHVLIWERAEILPALNDTSVYWVLAEIGVESALSSWLRFRVAAQNRYDSQPAEDKEKNDFFTSASLVAEY